MDNLKYYNDSFVYNYDIFAPKTAKKAEVLKYPETSKSVKRRKAAVSIKAEYITKSVVAFMILAAVCGSLFLRAEISSLKTEIGEINNEIVELESEATRLNVEIERKISLTNLEQAATEMGMHKREKNQVTYIKSNQIDSAETAEGKLTAQVE